MSLVLQLPIIPDSFFFFLRTDAILRGDWSDRRNYYSLSFCCALVQFVQFSAEEHSALTGKIQQRFLKGTIFALQIDEDE